MPRIADRKRKRKRLCRWSGRQAPLTSCATTSCNDILQLRMQVFILEQESIYLDLDGKDRQARHMLGTVAGGLCAYQRCLPPGASYPESSLGRIVVASKWRRAIAGQGAGFPRRRAQPGHLAGQRYLHQRPGSPAAVLLRKWGSAVKGRNTRRMVFLIEKCATRSRGGVVSGS